MTSTTIDILGYDVVLTDRGGLTLDAELSAACGYLEDEVPSGHDWVDMQQELFSAVRRLSGDRQRAIEIYATTRDGHVWQVDEIDETEA